VTSAVTSARAERYATIRLSAVWTAVFAACVLLAVVRTSPGPTIAFLLAMGLTTGVLVALTYPLGVAGAAQGAFSVAVVGALINLVWAVAGLLGPTVGGTAAQLADDRVWFVVLAVCGFGAAAWMWRRRGAAPSVAPVDANTRARRVDGT
jgi:MFS family permease